MITNRGHLQKTAALSMVEQSGESAQAQTSERLRARGERYLHGQERQFLMTHHLRR